MAERPSTLTQPLTRAQITEMIGGNPRLVRWFEGVVRDVTEVLANAAYANSSAAEAAQVTADAARIVADEALALVEDSAQGADTAIALAQSGLSEIGRLWAALATAGGGGGNSVAVPVDFGASFTDKAQAVVTGQAWVAAGSEIVAHLLTPAGADPDEMRLLDMRTVISDIVPGDGFTVTVYSETEAQGSYTVACIGV
jgi:hypothetical protein